jgi:hypothetical protein
MADEYIDMEFGGTVFRLTPEYVAHLAEAQSQLDAHLMALGQLSWSFSNLDHRIDCLFEPLLQCSATQVACMMVENIATRCSQLVRLLHLESSLSVEFRDWTIQLLNRVSGELAEERNRNLHDRWKMRWSEDEKSVTRIDKRPKIGKAQSRQPVAVTFNQQHLVTPAQIQGLADRMATVSHALEVVMHSLATWRQLGSLPPLDPQWLPASKAKALGRWDEGWPGELPQPPPPTRYE